MSKRRFLVRHHYASHGDPGEYVHSHICHGEDSRLDRPVDGNDG